jgi:hypothetical protein
MGMKITNMNKTSLIFSTLSMIKPPTISGQVKDFWSVYSILISILEAGFAGALSTCVFWLSKNRKKEDFCHQLKYPQIMIAY